MRREGGGCLLVVDGEVLEVPDACFDHLEQTLHLHAKTIVYLQGIPQHTPVTRDHQHLLAGIAVQRETFNIVTHPPCQPPRSGLLNNVGIPLGGDRGFRSDVGTLRDQICTTFGPNVNYVIQVDF